MEINNNSGLIEGKSHEEGGVKTIVAPTGTIIETELGEYNICRSGFESPEVYSFIQKTNKEILDEIHQKESCKYVPGQAEVKSFIVCKLVVQDEVRRDRKGNVKQILNDMQSEKSCNVSEGSDTMATGGSVTDCPCEHDEFWTDVWENYLWWCHVDYSENIEAPNNEHQQPVPPIQQPIAPVPNV